MKKFRKVLSFSAAKIVEWRQGGQKLRRVGWTGCSTFGVVPTDSDWLEDEGKFPKIYRFWHPRDQNRALESSKNTLGELNSSTFLGLSSQLTSSSSVLGVDRAGFSFAAQ